MIWDFVFSTKVDVDVLLGRAMYGRYLTTNQE